MRFLDLGQEPKPITQVIDVVVPRRISSINGKFIALARPVLVALRTASMPVVTCR
jgi:uncharacterized membrane protein